MNNQNGQAIRSAAAYLDSCRHTRVALRFGDDTELDLPIADFLSWLQKNFAPSHAALPPSAIQLLRDIQSNMAIGEPEWSDIESRIEAVLREALTSQSADRHPVCATDGCELLIPRNP